MFDSNAIFQAQTTVTANGNGPWIDMGFGTPVRGVNLGILVNGIAGNPNCLFKVQTSDDQIDIYDNAIDERGQVRSLAQRNIHFATQRRYARIAWLFGASDPGEGSLNSSSSSSQSFNSSSSGGTTFVSFFAGLTISQTG